MSWLLKAQWWSFPSLPSLPCYEMNSNCKFHLYARDRDLLKMCTVSRNLERLDCLVISYFSPGILKFKLCQVKNVHQYFQLFTNFSIKFDVVSLNEILLLYNVTWYYEHFICSKRGLFPLSGFMCDSSLQFHAHLCSFTHK